MHRLLTLLLATFLLFCFYKPVCASQSTVVKVGHYQLSETTESLLGPNAAKIYKDIIPEGEEIIWQVFVPSNYSADKPPGIIVYISPSNSGKIPKEWTETMSARNLIWISANKSGNKINSHKRVSYAAFAAAAISENYEINEDRIYVSGFSGGGRIASFVATEYPQVFKGAIYICGTNFWGKREPRNLALVKRNRYVFITGKKDFNYRDTKKVYGLYKKANIDSLYFYDIPNLKHERPGAENIDRALQFLDTAS